MSSGESGICVGIFEGSVIVRIVIRNIVVESGIRDGGFHFRGVLCVFW